MSTPSMSTPVRCVANILKLGDHADASWHSAQGEKWQQVSFPQMLALLRACILLQAHPADVNHYNSRQAIKKYVKANNKITITSEAQFDSMFNKALKSGVDKGDFTQPKGMLNSVPYLSRQSAVSLIRACNLAIANMSLSRSLWASEACEEGGQTCRPQNCCTKGPPAPSNLVTPH